MHLVDQARAHIEDTYKRPLLERWIRSALAAILPRRALLRLALALAPLGQPLAPLLPKQMRALLNLSTQAEESLATLPYESVGSKGRVALLTGCVQDVLGGHVHEATVRLLGRYGVSVVAPSGTGCCGALAHHLGKDRQAKAQARALINAFQKEIDGKGLDAIIVNASGCGTVLKDYGHLFANDPDMLEKAQRIADLSVDVTEYLASLSLPPVTSLPVKKIAYHSACSLQHGQQVTSAPKALLHAAGFEVTDIPEGHLCCGSAGTYNILQPEIAGKLQARKAEKINSVHADVVAAGNIGCITQLSRPVTAPVVHTVELLDWATGGPPPKAMR